MASRTCGGRLGSACLARICRRAEVGARLGRAVTIRDGRVGAEGRDGQDFAVVAGDGSVQLPPAIITRYPPGTLFTVDQEEGTVSLVVGGVHGVLGPPSQTGDMQNSN